MLSYIKDFIRKILRVFHVFDYFLQFKHSKKIKQISRSNNIKFSVIMCTYNRSFCICNAIDSLLNQIYTNWELIIVDDYSTDSTKDIIFKKYHNEISTQKIKYFKNHKNLGPAAARNIGLSKTSNEWIAYLDSDNVLDKKFLGEFAFYINKYPNTNAFYAKMIRSDGTTCGKPFNYSDLLKGNYIDLGIFVHHSSLVKKYGFFDETLTKLEDWDLIIRYCKDNRPIFINQFLLKYSSSTEYDRISNSESDEKCFKQITNKYKNSK